jgi:uncharacterized protein (DUF433 family)
MKSFELQPRADRELNKSAGFYEEQVPGLGDRFLDDFMALMRRAYDRGSPLSPAVLDFLVGEHSMAVISDIGELIARNPEIRQGRPILAGTGVSVRSVAVRYKRGLTPEQIAASYGHLSLAQVYAALAYYHANREEIEADLADEDQLYDRLVSEQQSRRQTA